jgi:hypothetical protein
MTRLLAVSATLLLAAASDWGQTPFVRLAGGASERGLTPQRALRFHHLHYVVDNPGAQLRPASDALQGARSIVPGLGVGVRVDREYLLFARAPLESTTPRRRTPRAADAYADAVKWLTRQGLSVTPRTLNETLVSRSLPREPLDHVAFAADDLAQTLTSVKAKPVTSNDVAATFKTASGALVEIVQDTDRPDAYWCPMHPGIRSPAGGKCPLCGMPLVTIPPLRSGEYRVEAELLPRSDGGASRIRLAVRDPESDALVSSFVDVHERPFHLFVISRDLEQFAHVHPVQNATGVFELDQPLAPGMYLLIADFLPVGGTSQLVHRMVATPGYTGPMFASPPALAVGAREQVVNGIRIRMSVESPAPRRPMPIRFEIADASNGVPVTDLESFLGAPGHLLIVDNGLTTAIHGHPEGDATAAAAVTFAPVVPADGRYKLWVQFQRKGEVITAPFVIDVRSQIQ